MSMINHSRPLSFASLYRRKDSTTDGISSRIVRASYYQNDSMESSSNSIIHSRQGIGNQAIQRLMYSDAGFDFAKIAIQPKLKVNRPGDAYEQEADRVAEQVMRITDLLDSSVPMATTKDDEKIHRKCAACEMEEEEDKKLDISRKTSNASSIETTDKIANEISNVRSGTSSSLEEETKRFMESRFGYDFSNVRIHTDENAAKSAQSVNALAYTVGNNIVFGEGQYQPHSNPGRRLIAHELAHVVQQNNIMFSKIPRDETSSSATDKSSTSDSLSGFQHPSVKRKDGALITKQVEKTMQPYFLQAGSSDLKIQRQIEFEDDLTDTETEEEYDSEVYDGDSPVSASPDKENLEKEIGFSESILTEINEEENPETLAELVKRKPTEISSTQVITAQMKGKTTAPPPAKKPHPKTITTIDVDQATQKMTITWSDGSTESHAVSTGKGLPNTKDDPCKTQGEKNCTPNGSFTVGSLGNANTENKHGDRMSWYVGFVDDRGIGIHDSQPVPGVPASHGCVRVGNRPEDDALAKKINKHVISGKTTVIVHGKAPTKPWKKTVPAPKNSKRKKK